MSGSCSSIPSDCGVTDSIGERSGNFIKKTKRKKESKRKAKNSTKKNRIDNFYGNDILNTNQAENHRQIFAGETPKMWDFGLLFLIPYNQDMYVWTAVRGRSARTGEKWDIDFSYASGCVRKRVPSRVSVLLLSLTSLRVKENTAMQSWHGILTLRRVP